MIVPVGIAGIGGEAGMDSDHDSRTRLPADSMRWQDSLRTRMALWSGLLNAALLLATTLAFYLGARVLVVHNARAEALGLARQTARNLEAVLDSVQVSGRTLAAGATGVDSEPVNLRSLLVASLAGDPDIAGAMIIVEPGRLSGDDDGFTWYIRRDGGRLVEQSVEDLGYDYAAMPWFVRTVASPRPWWSEPYANDATAGIPFTTHNLPLRLPGDGPDAPAVGMVSLDVPVSRLLRDIVDGLPDGDGIQPMLFSPEGLAVVHPRPDVRMRKHLREFIDEYDRADLEPLALAVEGRRPVDFEHRVAASGEDFITLAVPVGDSGWTFAASVPEGYILRQLNRIALWVALVGVLALLLVLWLVRRYTARILRPIRDLTRSARHFARGEFDYPLDHVERRDEVGVMARAFNVARGSIKRQMREIEDMAGARQKIESELAIARDIQQAMLPHGRRVDAGRVHVDAHAVLKPAKAVGGDFYQFAEIEPGVLWFVIGDVSDKGVPAALFMARTATVLESLARRSTAPDRILAAASRRLTEGNDTCMFATVLCGCMDAESGRFQLASAGHDPPVLLHPDGRTESLALETGPPLGFEPSEGFVLLEGRLPAGATLVAFTDGVTEAFDARNDDYGHERLLRALVAGDDAERTCRRVLQDVQHFAGDAEQSDDITILAIRRTCDVDTGGHADGEGEMQPPSERPGDMSMQMAIAGDPARIADLTAAVETALADAGVDRACIHDARLVVEELACNALAHGAAADIGLRLRMRMDVARLLLEIDDDGPAFDPTAMAAPDLDAGIGERRIGGLGIHLVRQLADSFDYRRHDGRNLVRVTLRLSAATAKESSACQP